MKRIMDLRNFIRKDKSTKYFIIVQSFNYGVFMTLDIMGKGLQASILIKFILILICFFYVNIRPSVHFLWKLALFFTLIADVFLLLINNYYIYGLISFIIVQQLYGIYLFSVDKDKGKNIIGKLIIRLFVSAIATVIVSYVLYSGGIYLDALLILCVFYFLTFMQNLFLAVKEVVDNPQRTDLLVFTIGIFLFILCDVNVGLSNMFYYIDLPLELLGIISKYSFVLMWAFYGPSQVFISLAVAYSSNYEDEA